MKQVDYEGGWLEIRDPNEVTVAQRRKLQALLSSVSNPMQRIERATKVEIAKLGLPDGTELTEEQTKKALLDSTPEPPLTEDESDRMLQLEQAALVAAIGRWSRPEDITRATLDEMPAGVYDPIQKAAEADAGAILQHLSVDFEPTPDARDETPFGTSPDSSGPV